MRGYESRVEGLRGEVGRRDRELGQLREKVNNLTVALSDLRKELEVRGQEVIMARKEANSQIRSVHVFVMRKIMGQKL